MVSAAEGTELVGAFLDGEFRYGCRVGGQAAVLFDSLNIIGEVVGVECLPGAMFDFFCECGDGSDAIIDDRLYCVFIDSEIGLSFAERMSRAMDSAILPVSICPFEKGERSRRIPQLMS